MVIETAASPTALFDPFTNRSVVANTVAPSRNVAVPVGAVELPQPEPLINACTLNVTPVVTDVGGPKEGRHAMLEVTWLLTVIAVLSVAGVLQVSPEYCTVNVREPGVGIVMLAAASPSALLLPFTNSVVVARTVAPSRNLTVPVGAVELPHAEPLTRA
jgi:hypothetical protein